jgi:hypothetical protein
MARICQKCGAAIGQYELIHVCHKNPETMDDIRRETTVQQITCKSCGSTQFTIYHTYTYGIVAECANCQHIIKLEVD